MIALLVLASACGGAASGDPDPDPGSNPSLPTTTTLQTTVEAVVWQLDAYCETDFCIPAVEASDLRLDEGTISGTTGCNTFSGAYRLSPTTLETRDLAVTEIGCSPPIMDQERVVLAVLNATSAITVDGQMLFVNSGDLSLHYRRDR